jgi:hypothetical protein
MNDEDFEDIVRGIINDDGRAAMEHLAAGRAIYYGDEMYPDEIVREWPDGRRELVAVSAEGEVIVIREIEAKSKS